MKLCNGTSLVCHWNSLHPTPCRCEHQGLVSLSYLFLKRRWGEKWLVKVSSWNTPFPLMLNFGDNHCLVLMVGTGNLPDTMDNNSNPKHLTPKFAFSVPHKAKVYAGDLSIISSSLDTKQSKPSIREQGRLMSRQVCFSCLWQKETLKTTKLNSQIDGQDQYLKEL